MLPALARLSLGILVALVAAILVLQPTIAGIRTRSYVVEGRTGALREGRDLIGSADR